MKKMDICKFAGNLKRCIAEYNQSHDSKFNEAFRRAYLDNLWDLQDYSIIYHYQNDKKDREHRKVPSLDTLVVLADLLGVTPDELLY